MLREHLEQREKSQAETLRPENGEQMIDTHTNGRSRMANEKQSQERDNAIHMWTFAHVNEHVDTVDAHEYEPVAHFDADGRRAGASLRD